MCCLFFLPFPPECGLEEEVDDLGLFFGVVFCTFSMSSCLRMTSAAAVVVVAAAAAVCGVTDAVVEEDVDAAERAANWGNVDKEHTLLR